MSFKYALTILFCIKIAAAFDSEQLEVFDVVEEVKTNFYELLNITQDASNKDIKTAFRTLSLKLHPDKNLEIDTSEQFRNLVSVYEVLRSPSKRKYYDDVLVNGLPNWRSAVYYYRYARKMGITEVCVILFVIITIGQYLVNWTAYKEKVYTVQSNLQVKRKSKKTEIDDFIAQIPKPTIYDTLPFQIPRWIYYSIVSIPSACLLIKNLITETIEKSKQQKEEEEVVIVPKPKTVRKRNKGFVLPEGPNFESNPTGGTQNSSNNSAGYSAAPPPVSGGFWGDDDLAELIRLVKKYPQGAQGRWEKIADALGRSVPEVTFMANKMKENGYKVRSEQEEEPVPQVKVKQKTKKDVEFTDDVKNWTQAQQKVLEEALSRYSKGYPDRWDRIAECFENKTKEECILRVRYVAETIKKRKETDQETK